MKKLLAALCISLGLVTATGLSSSAQEDPQCTFNFEGETYSGSMHSGFCEQFPLTWRTAYKHVPPIYLQYVFTAKDAGINQDWDTAIINAERALNVVPDDYNAKTILMAATGSKKIRQGKSTVPINGQNMSPRQFWYMLTGFFIPCVEGCTSQKD